MQPLKVLLTAALLQAMEAMRRQGNTVEKADGTAWEEVGNGQDVKRPEEQQKLAAGPHHHRPTKMFRLTRDAAAPSSMLVTSVAEVSEEVETSGIPSIVFMTGPWKPELIIDTNKGYFPEHTEFRFYDDAGMAASIRHLSQELEEKAGVMHVADAFFMLRAMAYRADLWRAAVIWNHGGIYIDGKLNLRTPLTSFADLHHDRFAVCHDKGAMDKDFKPLHGFWNGFFSSRKHEPALLSVIKVIVENVRTRAYPGVLAVSGPVAMHRAMEAFAKEDPLQAANVPSVRCQFNLGHILPICENEELRDMVATAKVFRQHCMSKDPTPASATAARGEGGEGEKKALLQEGGATTSKIEKASNEKLAAGDTGGKATSKHPSPREMPILHLEDSALDMARQNNSEHELVHEHRSWYGTLYTNRSIYCDEFYSNEDDMCDHSGITAFGETKPYYDSFGILGPTRPMRAGVFITDPADM